MAATGDFRLSITRALGDQLASELEVLQPASLTENALAAVLSRGGVYQLFHLGDLVYIGKAESSVPDRLRQHRRKLSGRENMHVSEMSFTALYVDEDLSAVAPETLLIDRHRGAGALRWNFNGFGNKDPGKERDTSRVEADHFDALYPANLAVRCNVRRGVYEVGRLLAELKSDLPYVLRYQAGNRRRDLQPSEYWDTSVEVPADDMTAGELFELLSEVLPSEWQITVLPGYVIMYRERRSYPSARRVMVGRA